MGRAKKYSPSKAVDARKFNSKVAMKKKEDRLIKPGIFNVYSQNWIIGN